LILLIRFTACNVHGLGTMTSKNVTHLYVKKVHVVTVRTLQRGRYMEGILLE